MKFDNANIFLNQTPNRTWGSGELATDTILSINTIKKESITIQD